MAVLADLSRHNLGVRRKDESLINRLRILTSTLPDFFSTLVNHLIHRIHNALLEQPESPTPLLHRLMLLTPATSSRP